MLREGLDVHHKTSVSDVVSDADHAAEELIVRALRTARPADGMVGEEGTEHAGQDGRTWYIDPVDGTYNFLSGLPYWCSAVALADGAATPVLGAVYHPAADELWLGGPGSRPAATGRRCRRWPTPAAGASCRWPATCTRPPCPTPAPGSRCWRDAARRGHRPDARLGLARAGRGGRRPARAVGAARHPGLGLAARRRAGRRGRAARSRCCDHRGHRWHLAGNRQAVAEARALLLG